MRKHYHVISGDHGYMPDYNQVCQTKQEAQAAIADWRRICEDAVYQALNCLPAGERDKYAGVGRPFVGSAKEGYYEGQYPTSIAGLEYIELAECREPECLEWED